MTHIQLDSPQRQYLRHLVVNRSVGGEEPPQVNLIAAQGTGACPLPVLPRPPDDYSLLLLVGF